MLYENIKEDHVVYFLDTTSNFPEPKWVVERVVGGDTVTRVHGLASWDEASAIAVALSDLYGLPRYRINLDTNFTSQEYAPAILRGEDGSTRTVNLVNRNATLWSMLEGSDYDTRIVEVQELSGKKRTITIKY